MYDSMTQDSRDLSAMDETFLRAEDVLTQLDRERK